METAGATCMATSKPCAVCRKDSSLRCSHCQLEHYCSKEHQKEHWKIIHKYFCRTFTIERLQDEGRYVVAARDLHPGSLVLQEAPLVIAPKQCTRPVCLGCFRYVGENSPKCSSCGWPMCSPDCSQMPQHRAECIYTCRRKTQLKPHVDSEQCDAWKVRINNFEELQPIYSSIILLRCLYLKEQNKEAWDKLISLESHADKRKMRAEVETAVGEHDWVVTYFSLDENEANDFKKIVGIVAINGQEIPLPELMDSVGRATSFVALFHNSSYIEHNCTPNCRKTYAKSAEIVVRTTGLVTKGERLNISWTDLSWSTIVRKKHILELRKFICRCRRCEDPTELGTFMSAIRCSKCKYGYCVPVKHSSTGDDNVDDIIKDYHWECWGKANNDSKKELGCGNSINCEDVLLILTDQSRKLSDIKRNDLKLLHTYLRATSDTVLHKSHQFVMEAKLELLRLLQSRLNSIPNRLRSKEIPEVKLMESTAKDLLDVANIIFPGMTEIRGTLLYILYAKRVSKFATTVSKMLQPRHIEREMIMGLRESVNILSLELAESPYAAMAAKGRQIIRTFDGLGHLAILQ